MSTKKSEKMNDMNSTGPTIVRDNKDSVAVAERDVVDFVNIFAACLIAMND